MAPFLWTLSPFVLALVVAPICARVALAVGLVDRPRADRFSGRPTPKLGGLVIVLAALPASLHVLATGASPVLAAGAVGLSLAFLTGLLDDALTLSPSLKLTGQVVSAVLSLWLLARAAPVTGILAGVPTPLLLGAGLVWIVGFQNAVNFLDNMDGIVGGVVMIGLVALAVHLAPGARALPLLVGAAVAGFLPWNTRSPARLFLGDAGALPLGHALGFTALAAAWRAPSTAHAAALLVVVLIPLVDITFVTITRLAAGRSPAVGGRDHTTHRLFARLGSVAATRRVFWGSALALAVLSLGIRALPSAGALVSLAVVLGGACLVGRRFAAMPTPDVAAAGD